MSSAAHSEAWKALQTHQQQIASQHMRDLFKEDPGRFEKFHLRFEDILLDFSKNRITDETLRLLLDLAEQADLEGWTEKMFTGQKINTTEDRAVLHVALRNREQPADPRGRQGRDAGGERGAGAHAASSPRRSAAAPGRATPASRSPTWSTSASAGRTSAR